MKNAPDRYAYGRASRPFTVVSEYCSSGENRCAGTGAGGRPWLKSQDLQGFAGAKDNGLRPIATAALFASDESGGRLSDHDAYLVRYRLSSGLGSFNRRLQLASAQRAPRRAYP